MRGLQSPFEPPRHDGQRKRHRQVERRAQGARNHPAPEIGREDLSLFRQLQHGEDRDERRVLEQRDEVVGHGRERQPQRLRSSDEPEHLAFAQAERSARFELTDGHRLERRSINLALVGGVVERQPEQRGGKGRQLDGGGDAVIEDEELQQERRPAHQLHVADEKEAQRPGAVDASSGNEHAEDHRESHRQAREHDGDGRGAQQRRKVPPRGLPSGEGDGAGGRVARRPMKPVRRPAASHTASAGPRSTHSICGRSARASRHASRCAGRRRSCPGAAASLAASTPT